MPGNLHFQDFLEVSDDAAMIMPKHGPNLKTETSPVAQLALQAVKFCQLSRTCRQFAPSLVDDDASRSTPTPNCHRFKKPSLIRSLYRSTGISSHKRHRLHRRISTDNECRRCFVALFLRPKGVI